jgi:hypothetical protein
MEIETRSFQMQNKSFVLSQCYSSESALNSVSEPMQKQMPSSKKRLYKLRHCL